MVEGLEEAGELKSGDEVGLKPSCVLAVRWSRSNSACWSGGRRGGDGVNWKGLGLGLGLGLELELELELLEAWRWCCRERRDGAWWKDGCGSACVCRRASRVR